MTFFICCSHTHFIPDLFKTTVFVVYYVLFTILKHIFFPSLYSLSSLTSAYESLRAISFVASIILSFTAKFYN